MRFVRKPGVRRIRVVVTQEDIDKGERSESESCPIALALTRRPDMHHPVVGTYMFSDRGTGLSGHLSSDATDFVKFFDRNGPKSVQPGTFYLTVTHERVPL